MKKVLINCFSGVLVLTEFVAGISLQFNPYHMNSGRIK